MYKLLLSPEAEKDLERIYEYTFYKWNARQADKYQDALYEGMKTILSNVEIGESYAHSKLFYRKLEINKHLIFYRTEGEICLVVRILHERMNLIKQLGNE